MADNSERYHTFTTLRKFVLRPLAMEQGPYVFSEELGQMNEDPSGMISQTFRYLYGGKGTQVRLRWLPRKRGYELTIFRSGALYFRAVASPSSVHKWMTSDGNMPISWVQSRPLPERHTSIVPTQPAVADREARGAHLLKRYSIRMKEEAWLRRNPKVAMTNDELLYEEEMRAHQAAAEREAFREYGA